MIIELLFLNYKNYKTIRILEIKKSKCKYRDNEVLSDYNHEILRVFQLKDGRLYFY